MCLALNLTETYNNNQVQMAHNYTGCLVPIQLGTGTYNFPEKLPTTVSETEAKVFVMEISSKQFQFVRSSSRLDVMMGPLRWVITAQTTTRKGKIGGNNSNFVSADISRGASGQSIRVNHCEKKGACVMDVLTPGGGGGWVGWWVGGWMGQPFPQCVCVCVVHNCGAQPHPSQEFLREDRVQVPWGAITPRSEAAFGAPCARD